MAMIDGLTRVYDSNSPITNGCSRVFAESGNVYDYPSYWTVKQADEEVLKAEAGLTGTHNHSIPRPCDRFRVAFEQCQQADRYAHNLGSTLRKALIAFADTMAEDQTLSQEHRDFAQLAKHFIERSE